MSTARTPRVQLVLQLQEPQQERILHVTAGHEVVEDVRNGVRFQFKRKRSSVADPAVQPPTATACKSHLLKTPAAHKAHPMKTPVAQLVQQQAATTAAVAASPYADEVEMPRGLGERLLQGIHALPERAMPAERLLAFCSSICAASAEAMARRPRGEGRAAALESIFGAFQQDLADALQDGSVQLAAPARPATPLDDGEVEQADYQVDLQARKEGLRARLANFQKEEEEWHALLAKVEQLDQQQLAAAADVDAGLDSGAGIDAADAVVAAAAASPPPGDELAVLARVHADVHRHLAIQVEGVCKLVGDVEEMVQRANRSAQAVQAEYHAEKFRVFPHVNSPARLIRELVRPAAAKAAPPQQQATGGGKENGMEVE